MFSYRTELYMRDYNKKYFSPCTFYFLKRIITFDWPRNKNIRYRVYIYNFANKDAEIYHRDKKDLARYIFVKIHRWVCK